MRSSLHNIAVLAGLMFGLQLSGSCFAAPAWQEATAHQFRSLKLAPVGRSYAHPVKLERQSVVAERSSVQLTDLSGAERLDLLSDLVLDTTVRQPRDLEAELIFVGSHDPGPEALRRAQGKVVVLLEATAKAMSPGAWAALKRSGAAGILTLAAEGAPAPAVEPATYLAGETPAQLSGALSSHAAERLFARAGRPYREAVALAEAGRPVPGFAFGVRLKASLTLDTRTFVTANMVGVVRGSDPLLSREFVAVSADAGSASAVLDAARRLQESGARPKRSIIFAVFTPEDGGAPGAGAFAAHPPVGRDQLVANLGARTAPGATAALAVAAAGETSLGALVLDAATDERPALSAGGEAAYRFLEAGVPAVLLTFGGSTSPDAAYLLALALKVADNDAHPGWTRGSRFAPLAPHAEEALVAPVDLPRDRRPRRSSIKMAMLSLQGQHRFR